MNQPRQDKTKQIIHETYIPQSNMKDYQFVLSCEN